MLIMQSQNKEIIFPLNSPITIEKSQSIENEWSIVGWIGDKGVALGNYKTNIRAKEILEIIYVRSTTEYTSYSMPQE